MPTQKQAFLITYDIIMNGKTDEEKSEFPFPYLDGNVWNVYSTKFISGRSVTVEGLDYKAVFEWPVDQFSNQNSVHEKICIALNVEFDFSDL